MWCPAVDWCETSAVFSVVDEYIAIAKEKHGYNVEQVGLQYTRIFFRS